MKADNALTTTFIEQHPVAAARALEHVLPESVVMLLEELDESLACLLFRYFMSDYAALCLVNMSDRLVSECAERIPVDMCRVLLQLESEQRQVIVNRLTSNARKQVQMRLDYPVGSIGTSLKTDSLIFTSGLSVGDVLKRMEKLKKVDGFRLNVVDEQHRLLGSLGTARLLSADKHTKIETLLSKQKRPPVLVTGNMSEMMNHPGWISNRQLPVVDRDGVYLGELDYEAVLAYHETFIHDRKPLEPFGSVISLAGVYWLSVSWLLESLFSRNTHNRND
ncbi:MAG: hypothetical protein EP315_01085 [Gammaproteobacteria bacterium]|nr:MAG: hypothetical protein EP315_01085 [Gammaproteobacteria bacterium]